MSNFYFGISTFHAPCREFEIARFCYPSLVALTHDEIHGHSTQAQDPAPPPQPLRRHFRCRVPFHPRRFSPLLAGVGLHGHVVPAHAPYVGLFPEARSPTRRTPPAPRRI